MSSEFLTGCGSKRELELRRSTPRWCNSGPRKYALEIDYVESIREICPLHLNGSLAVFFVVEFSTGSGIQ